MIGGVMTIVLPTGAPTTRKVFGWPVGRFVMRCTASMPSMVNESPSLKKAPLFTVTVWKRLSTFIVPATLTVVARGTKFACAPLVAMVAAPGICVLPV